MRHIIIAMGEFPSAPQRSRSLAQAIFSISLSCSANKENGIDHSAAFLKFPFVGVSSGVIGCAITAAFLFT
ncbi:MAG: hypothetical protein JSR32_02915 [Proteobacteria bacterium]|nr:hypothetical protein [Pseudomonadota bacterium]